MKKQVDPIKTLGYDPGKILAGTESWTTKAAREVRTKFAEGGASSALQFITVDDIASIIAAHAEPRVKELEAEIDAAWFGIEHGFDIETRADLEAQSKTNGFKYGLAQAVHHLWKRDPKVEPLIALLRESKHGHWNWCDASIENTRMSDDRCTCGADAYNAKVDAVLGGPQ